MNTGELVQTPSAAKMRQLSNYFVQRVQWMRSHLTIFKGRRDMTETLGYPCEPILPYEYRAMYERGGVAGRIVDAYPKSCWRGQGDLVEVGDPKNVTEFEKAWREVADRLAIWPVFLGADTVSANGRYSIILMGAEGLMETELPKSRNGSAGLFYLNTYSEEDATIEAWETDVFNPRFGRPKVYKLSNYDASQPKQTKLVHWSRVHHIACDKLDSSVFGQPRLQRCFNRLIDLEKVTGGGSEAFWMRANAGTQFDLDPEIELKADAKAEFAEMIDKYIHNMTRILKTRGMKVNQLGSQVANFADNADAILTQIAGSIGIPKRILMGSEMGQLASGQDRDNWDTQVQDRRDSFCGPQVVKPFVNRLIHYGYLPTPKQYRVLWPTIDNMTETERAEGAKSWAETNRANGVTVYSEDEIRDHWHGMPPLDSSDEDGSAPIETAAGKKSHRSSTLGRVLFRRSDDISSAASV